MIASVVSIAEMEPLEGAEQEFLGVIADLYSLMERKGYSRNVLLRAGEPLLYLNLRYWNSPQARQEAQEDPEVHRHWMRLAGVCHICRVHEVLEEVDWKSRP
jgi:hypothetical protein